MKLPIPTDWDGQTFCDFAICWPDSLEWRAILRGFVTLPSRGRTWDERTGTITEIQAVGRVIDRANRPLRSSLMSCQDVSILITGMQQIADAIRYQADRACSCGGSVGSQGQGQSQPQTDDTDTVNQTGPVPEGHESWEAYLDYKCAVAQKIISDAIQDIGRMGGLVLAGVAISELALVLGPILLTPWPWDDIIAIALILLQIAVAGGTILNDARDTLLALEEDLLCDLYVSSNAQNAADRWVNRVVDYVDTTYPTQPNNILVKAVLATFAQASVMNQLAGAPGVDPPAAGDCSECATPCIVVWTFADALADWTFEDESDSGSSHTFELLTGNGFRWTNDVANLPDTSAIGSYTIEGDGMVIHPGDQFQIDHEQEGVNVGIAVIVTLDDMSTQSVFKTITPTGTYSFTFTTLTGVIDTIEVRIINSTSGSASGYVNTGIVREARLYLGDTTICIGGN